MDIEMEPFYQHDCESCIFLGATLSCHSLHREDWYYCASCDVGDGTVICRYGSEGPEYWASVWDWIKDDRNLAIVSSEGVSLNARNLVARVMMERAGLTVTGDRKEGLT